MTSVVNKKRVNVELGDNDVVYIGRRDGGTRDMRNGEIGEDFGNPWSMSEVEATGEEAREEVVERFEDWLKSKLAQGDEEGEQYRKAVKQLHGKTLVCYCAPKQCHGDVLKKWAEKLHEWD